MFGPQSQNTLYSVDMTAIQVQPLSPVLPSLYGGQALNACPFCQKPFKYMVELEREVSFRPQDGRRSDGAAFRILLQSMGRRSVFALVVVTPCRGCVHLGGSLCFPEQSSSETRP